MLVEAPEVTEVEETMDEKVDKLLEKAEWAIREHGWCQRQCRAQNGSLCIAGGILMALNTPLDAYNHFAADRPRSDSELTLLAGCQHRLDRLTGSNDYARWNDHPGRTVDEVYALLQEARQHD